MKNFIVLVALFTAFHLHAQKPDEEAIMKEGKLLYTLEKASWYATDHFLANFADKRDSIGGYLSYEGDDDYIYSIFFSRFDNDRVLVRYKFAAMPTEKPIDVDTIRRTTIKDEVDLIAIRQHALDMVYSNRDEFFTFYNNTSLNPIPVIKDKERKVYILTAPKQHGSVLIGNDYLLEYNSKNKLRDKNKLHTSLIELPYNPGDGQKIEATMHSHVLSNHIEPTDICTLLLYKDYVGWSRHVVVHQEYMSILDMQEESLLIMKKDSFDKMMDNQRKDK